MRPLGLCALDVMTFGGYNWCRFVRPVLGQLDMLIRTPIQLLTQSSIKMYKVTYIVLYQDVCSSINQNARHFDVPLLGRQHQGCAAILKGEYTIDYIQYIQVRGTVRAVLYRTGLQVGTLTSVILLTSAPQLRMILTHVSHRFSTAE